MIILSTNKSFPISLELQHNFIHSYNLKLEYYLLSLISCSDNIFDVEKSDEIGKVRDP